MTLNYCRNETKCCCFARRINYNSVNTHIFKCLYLVRTTVLTLIKNIIASNWQQTDVGIHWNYISNNPHSRALNSSPSQEINLFILIFVEQLSFTLVECMAFNSLVYDCMQIKSTADISLAYNALFSKIQMYFAIFYNGKGKFLISFPCVMEKS